MMDEIDLLTRTGEFVVTVRMLPFRLAPEVITWGQRIFVRREDGKYYEGFAAFATETVDRNKSKDPGERHTCPRRSEGPRCDEKDGDLWSIKDWRFTDAEAAARWNQAEADRQNAEDKAKGHNCTTTPNLRYWLWPGPGPMPRICSYCGCVKPEDAIRLVAEFAFELEGTTKGYKLYLHPPGFKAHTERFMAALRGRDQDLVEVAAAEEKKYHEVAPPLKLYSPHFSEEQWKSLWGKKQF